VSLRVLIERAEILTASALRKMLEKFSIYLTCCCLLLAKNHARRCQYNILSTRHLSIRSYLKVSKELILTYHIPFALEKPPLVIVITGPAGVGKDSVIKELRRRGVKFHFVVTATTRQARDHEQDGVDYFFYDQPKFESLIQDGFFLEHTFIHKSYRGVPRSQIEPYLARGEDVVIRPDVQGALRIQKVFPRAVLILLVPESLNQLSAHMIARGTESLDEIASRVSTAKSELSHTKYFDYIIVNREGKLAETVTCIEAIVLAEKCSARHIQDYTIKRFDFQ
jgi:guanylate kinase